MTRRALVATLGIAVVASPLLAHAQQQPLPIVAFFSSATLNASDSRSVNFRKGLSEMGYTDGRNVTIEYHGLEGRFDRLPAILDELIHRRVAVIATPGSNPSSLAAKAATSTIPIVFGVGDDPVAMGLVASLARPGGNMTGVNWFSQEVTAKRLRLLHDLVPKAVRVALLVNRGNTTSTEVTVREGQKAAAALGIETRVLNASTIADIDVAFATMTRERADALYVASDAFFNNRRVQIATLAARDRIPASYSTRDTVDVGGLMSYGADIHDMFRQVGIYTGRILKGEKPADLPVLQSTKFEFILNLQTARALGIEVPPGVLSIADEVIE